MPFDVNTVAQWLSNVFSTPIDADKLHRAYAKLDKFLVEMLESDLFIGDYDSCLTTIRTVSSNLDPRAQQIILVLFLKIPQLAPFWPCLKSLTLVHCDIPVMNLLVNQALIISPNQWLYASCLHKHSTSFLVQMRENLKHYLLQKHIVGLLRTVMLLCDVTSAYFLYSTCENFGFNLGFTKLASSFHPIIPFYLDLHRFNDLYTLKSILSSSTNKLLKQERVCFLNLSKGVMILWSYAKEAMHPSFFKTSHISSYLQDSDDAVCVFFESDCFTTSIVSPFTKIKKLSLILTFVETEQMLQFVDQLKKLPKVSCKFCPIKIQTQVAKSPEPLELYYPLVIQSITQEAAKPQVTQSALSKPQPYELQPSQTVLSQSLLSQSGQLVLSSKPRPVIKNRLIAGDDMNSDDECAIISVSPTSFRNGDVKLQKRQRRVAFSSTDTDGVDTIDTASDVTMETTLFNSPDYKYSRKNIDLVHEMESFKGRLQARVQSSQREVARREEKILNEVKEIMKDTKSLHEETLHDFLRFINKYKH